MLNTDVNIKERLVNGIFGKVKEFEIVANTVKFFTSNLMMKNQDL